MHKTSIKLGLLIAIAAGTAFGEASVISSAMANFAVNPPTLTINGEDFDAGRPTVTLS